MANTEEGAAASEELSAQAATMEAFVESLVMLVEGRRGGLPGLNQDGVNKGNDQVQLLPRMTNNPPPQAEKRPEVRKGDSLRRR